MDHNSMKGHCDKLANEKGVATARLPIGEFIELKKRHVLTINHVFEIILSVAQGNSWQPSFMSVLPQRSEAKVKSQPEHMAASGACYAQTAVIDANEKTEETTSDE